MLKVWTSQFRYSGEDRIDITVKSAKYPWNVFAPTWKMVMEYKRTGDRQTYIDQYDSIVMKAFIAHEQELVTLTNSDRTITLVCFCRAGEFCHRVLLAQHFASIGATYYGER
jgi:hypothetical protein